MDDRPIDFELEDAHGQPHRYLLTLHGALAGRRIVFRLLALLGPSAGELLGSLLKAEPVAAALKQLAATGTKEKRDAVAAGALADLLDGDLSALLGSLRAGDAAQRLAGAAAELAAEDDRLVDELVMYAVRDDRKLSVAAEFDRAFRGNYVELLALLWRVVSENRFFPVPSTSSTPSAK